MPTDRQKMTARIRLIKKRELLSRGRTAAKIRLASGPTNWSKSVRSWVVEFQEQDRSEVQPAFDSLFKVESSEQPGNSD